MTAVLEQKRYGLSKKAPAFLLEWEVDNISVKMLEIRSSFQDHGNNFIVLKF